MVNTGTIEPENVLQRVTRSNPFSSKREIELIELIPGAPLAHYIARYDSGPVTVIIDGEIIPPERRMVVVPTPGQQLIVLPVVAGGDSGKMVLRTLAMAAVIAAAIFVPGGQFFGHAFHGLLGLHGAAAAITSAGIMLGGTMLANYALTPRSRSNETPSTYSWAGPVATIQQGQPIAKLCGKTRVTLAGYPIASYTTASGRQQNLHALYSLGWGRTRSISDVRINDNPASNYSDITIETRPGANDQTPISDFTSIQSQRPQNTRIRTGDTPVTVAGDRSDTQAIEIQIYFPRGLWAGPGSGNKYDNWTVWIKLEYKRQGDSVWQSQTQTFGDCCLAALTYTMRVSGLTPGKYDIRITKLGSANYSSQSPATGNGGDIPSFEDSTRRGEEVWLHAINEIVYQSLAYPNIALLAVRGVATDQLSGSMTVSALAEAEVPDSVSGTALESFAADNPAVVAYDALVNDLYGAGINPALIDMDAWAEWAAWCDEPVPDGKGGTIKRATYNALYAEDGNVWDFVQSVARIARSVILRTGTKYTVVTDKPQPATLLFTMGNIVKDSFKESWLPLADRANSVEVYYYDETDDYKRKSVMVQDLEAIASGKPIIPGPTIDLRGATTWAQAWRAGMYLIRTNKYLLRSCEFDAPADAVACMVGDVIAVQHDVPQWGVGGRVVSGSGTALKLDRQVTMEEGKRYVVTCTLPVVQKAEGAIDRIVGSVVGLPFFSGSTNVLRLVSGGRDVKITGFGEGYVEVEDASGLSAGQNCALYDVNVLETRNVVTEPGSTDTITLESGFAADLQEVVLYAFGEKDNNQKPFRVVSIGRSRDMIFSIRCTEYAPEIFEDLEPVLPPDQSTAQSKISVSNLSAREIPNPTADLPGIAVSWTPGPLTLGAYVYVKRNYAPEKLELVVPGKNVATISNVASGDTVTVRVVGYGSRGAADHDTAPTEAVSVLGVGRMPQNVAGFYASACVASPASVTLNWAANPTADHVNHYEIRYGGTIANPQWEFSAPLTPNPGASATSATFASGPGYYLIAAVNSAGEASGVPTSCIAVVGGSTGGSGGGGYGGGVYGCFSGNVETETPDGWVRFDELPRDCKILNEYGDFDAELLVHEGYDGPMIDFTGSGDLVTPDHLMRYERGWQAARWHYPAAPRLHHAGTVYNLRVKSSIPGEQCFRLRNGDVAHNNKAPYSEL